ncbi:GMC family oxidoreductase N-terminal domain-containing protein [Halomonas janggokensis]|uniref:GMC family oxidoreductase N-terminal domain-containing protein n=1 Tax=Vreelandella janggokensis TaxID=370767 RepID=A0ABT4IV76_9GAMM|nr:GMC family oxidoreductase N-terminal domain-containing protein [Halomonas janggokensis]MCZ0927572.1 GMC family oxidoreductase N-terminal domain-containing protein [Halomonas janggokensis]MCZ0930080.1 GMC family oxidoreductase N-terminal domain-containing protein [Halomonas janggokensis]
MQQDYDYIIVGAGSAGCVMAHRLIQALNVSVLLVEAGGSDSSLLIRMPAAVGKVIPTHTWPYMTTPHGATNNRAMTIAQGRLIGGSSSVNGMIYIRGHRSDYDAWAHDHGCTGWDYDSLLPYFIRSEGNESLSGPFHGNDGPLKVSENRYRHPLTQAFVRAGQECGLPYVNDFNDNGRQGVGYYQTTTFEGERYSTSKAYLSQVRQNPRLTIMADTEVERVIIEQGKATGVQARHVRKGALTLHARREVIVSAGAIGSPRILMSSGIGPRDHLEEQGIECLRDLPVGDNLQDHLHLSINATLKEPTSLYGEDAGVKALRHGAEWLLHRRGLMTSNVLEGGAFLDTANEGRPDTQIHFMPVLDTWDDPNGIGRGRTHGITLKVGHLRPASRGTVRLSGSSDDRRAVINANFLDAPEDLAHQVRSLRAGLELLDTQALSSVIDDVFSPPEARHLMAQSRADSQQALEAFTRQYCKTTYHPVGTCRMGPDAEQSVVDLALNVHGVAGLRVIDCSVFPALPGGNTNAPTIAVAEKAADLLINAG